MTNDDYDLVERIVAESANALGIARPPAVFVPGASRVEIDMSGKYGKASDVRRLRRSVAAWTMSMGLRWNVWRMTPRRIAVSDLKTCGGSR